MVSGKAALVATPQTKGNRTISTADLNYVQKMSSSKNLSSHNQLNPDQITRISSTGHTTKTTWFPKNWPKFLAHKSHQKPRARQPQHAHRIDRHEGAHKDFSYKWSADHLGNSWLHVKPILRYVEILYLHHVQVQTYSTYNYIWSYKYVPIYVYIYIQRTYIRNVSIYLRVTYPYRGATSPSRQIPPSDGTNGCGDGHQDRQGHITTSQQSEKIRSRSWKWSTNCRLLDRFQIFTNHMFCWRFCCSVICLLWKPSNGDTMLVFAWFRATRNWISPPNLFLRLLCVWSEGFLAPAYVTVCLDVHGFLG